MRRASDEATGATLWHTTDGGPLARTDLLRILGMVV